MLFLHEGIRWGTNSIVSNIIFSFAPLPHAPPTCQLSWYSTSSLGDGDQGDGGHGNEDKEGVDQLIDKLGEEEEQGEEEEAEDKREQDEREKDQDGLDLGFLPKSHAIIPITVPEHFPNVPVLTLSRNPLFPRFVKMLEVSSKIPPLESFLC